MSVHYRHRSHLPLHSLQPTSRSPVLPSAPKSPYIPHTTITVIQHPLTPFELMVMLFALGILVSLVCWLTWILLEYAFTFAKDKYDDMRTQHSQNRERRSSEGDSTLGRKVGMVLGKMGLGTVASMLVNREGGGRRREDDGWDEGRGLIGADGNAEERRDQNEGRSDYGSYRYHEGMMYPALLGNERPRYADGISESSGCVGPMDGHKEECVGDNTMQTRRRSRDS